MEDKRGSEKNHQKKDPAQWPIRNFPLMKGTHEARGEKKSVRRGSSGGQGKGNWGRLKGRAKRKKRKAGKKKKKTIGHEDVGGGGG